MTHALAIPSGVVCPRWKALRASTCSGVQPGRPGSPKLTFLFPPVFSFFFVFTMAVLSWLGVEVSPPPSHPVEGIRAKSYTPTCPRFQSLRLQQPAGPILPSLRHEGRGGGL